MDSTLHSTPDSIAEIDRFERPLPPLPSPDSDTISPDGAEVMAESQTVSLREQHVEPTEPQPRYEQAGLSAEGANRGRLEDSEQASMLRNQSQSSTNSSIHRPESVVHQASQSNENLYLAEDSHHLSRSSSIHGSGAARSLRLNDNTSHSTPRSRSHSQTLVQTLQPPVSRTSPNESDSDESFRDFHNAPSHIRRRQIRQPEAEASRTEFIVPRWQPDAEVTMCPICRTQFSFFVRKHHCRKCGRVVCSACSPHRITIPYQYIVQPPTEGIAAPGGLQTRPSFDSQRADSPNQTGDLGGGERVRLCNPCVPDPNTAPPQSPVPHLRPSPHRSHSRSASTATASYNSPSNYRSREEVERLITNFPRRTRDPSIISGRPLPSSNSGRGTSYTDREGSLRPDLESRSRSSTVGSSRDSNSMGQFLGATNAFPGRSTPNGQQPYRPLIPRMDDSASRALSSRSRQPERRRIPEEDECWICHQELPSRTLDNFEKLRENHVEACLVAAMQGTSLSPAPAVSPFQPPGRTSSTWGAESSSRASQSYASSSTAMPVPVANTPEARTAAREQAHAAVVFGHSQPSSPGPSRRTGVFPYQATEKDCVDDAECTICLEEFEVGVEMGRLECFCRFHLHCIRQWFENHPGQCPVHQHGAGY